MLKKVFLTIISLSILLFSNSSNLEKNSIYRFFEWFYEQIPKGRLNTVIRGNPNFESLKNYNYVEPGIEYEVPLEKNQDDNFIYLTSSLTSAFYQYKKKYKTLYGLSEKKDFNTIKFGIIRVGYRRYFNNYYFSSGIGWAYKNSNDDINSILISLEIGYKYKVLLTPTSHISIGIGLDYYFKGISKDIIDFNYLGNSKILQKEEKRIPSLIFKYHF